VTYPEQKVEGKEDALRAFQPTADDHCCHQEVAASLRLQTSTSPALKKIEIPHTTTVFVCSRRKMAINGNIRITQKRVILRGAFKF